MGFILNVINLIDEPVLQNVASVCIGTLEGSNMNASSGEAQIRAH
jgi:hypothetical protein